MQEIIVFGLFAGVVGYFIYRIFFKKSGPGCAKCEYNKDAQ
ncbi:MAG: FeoB-associated Cys-rich membrane protein [Cryomorphaceae bacterium]|nr:FeoB-associated Cys-rich membrane protein [Flavobacteriales bacterium]